MKTKAQKRDYYLQWKAAQEAEDRGEYDHLIHCEEIVSWVSRGWPVAALTANANDRNLVRSVLGLAPFTREHSDDPFE